MADDPTDSSGRRSGQKGRRARKKEREEAAAAPEETTEEAQTRAQLQKKTAAERMVYLQKEKEALKKILETEEDRYAVKELENILAATNADLLKAQREHMRDLALLSEKIPEELKKQTIELEKIVKQEEKRASALQESDAAAAQLGKSLGEAFRVTRGGAVDVTRVGEKIKTMTKAVQAGSKGLKDFGLNLVEGVGYGYMQMVVDMATAIVKLSMEVENVGRTMRRTTGMSEDLSNAIQAGIPAVREYTHEFGGLADASAVLYRNFTDFTLINTKHAGIMAEEATMLNRLGVSYESYADGVQMATKGLGVATEDAAPMMRDLTAYAMNIGMDVGQLTSGFSASREHVMKFGNDGVKAFKDLARTSKITGIDIQRLFAITSKFDTFEGAAEQAGMLNAALGGNFVNAMDLMMETDPAARFDMIRDAIQGTAGSFEDMEYYQRIFYARAAGLDNVSELALVMSGNYDLLGEKMGKNTSEYVDMAKKARMFQTVQDELMTMLYKNIDVMPEVMQTVQEIIRFLGSSEGRNAIKNFMGDARSLVQGLNKVIGSKDDPGSLLGNMDNLINMAKPMGRFMAILAPFASLFGGVVGGVFANKLSTKLPGWMGGTPADVATKATKGPKGPGGGAPTRGDFTSRKKFRTAQRAYNSKPQIRARAAAAAAEKNKPGVFKRLSNSISSGFNRVKAALPKSKPSMFAKGTDAGRRGSVAVDLLTAGQESRLQSLGESIRNLFKSSKKAAPAAEAAAKSTTGMGARLAEYGRTATTALDPMLESVKAFFTMGPKLTALKGTISGWGRAFGKWLGPIALAIDGFFAFQGAFNSVTESVKRGEGILKQTSASISGALQGLSGGFKSLLSYLPGFDESGSLFKIEGADYGDEGTRRADTPRQAELQQRIHLELLKRAEREGTTVKHLKEQARLPGWKGGKTTARQSLSPTKDRDSATRDTVKAVMAEQSIRPQKILFDAIRQFQNERIPSTASNSAQPPAQDITVNLTLDGKVLDERTISTMGAAAGFGGITGMGYSP
jgi:hypothetical protein